MEDRNNVNNTFLKTKHAMGVILFSDCMVKINTAPR